MSSQQSQPPSSPAIAPRLRMRKVELVGMLLLAAIPTAAVLGLFGPTRAEAFVESEAIALRVTYPSVMRHRTHQDMLVHLHNRSGQELAQVQLSIDDDYLSAFNRILFSQAPAGPYTVRLETIAPGETRLVALEMEADGYGHHRGEVRATAQGRDLVAPIATLILP